jgi:hypothetical protein
MFATMLHRDKEHKQTQICYYIFETIREIMFSLHYCAHIGYICHNYEYKPFCAGKVAGPSFSAEILEQYWKCHLSALLLFLHASGLMCGDKSIFT